MMDERGAVGGLEGLAFGVLIFAFGTLMVLNAWAVVDGKIVAGGAAREATRAYVEANNDVDGRRAASDAVTSAAPNAIVSIDTVNTYARCQPVTATVSIKVSRVSLPLLHGTGGTMTVTANHTEVVDPYRSGLTAAAGCGAG